MVSTTFTDDQWIDQKADGPGVTQSFLHLCAYMALQIFSGAIFLGIGIAIGAIPSNQVALMSDPTGAVVAVLLGAVAAASLMGLWQRKSVKAHWAYKPSPDKKYPLLFTAALAGGSFAFVGIYNYLLQPPMQPEYEIFGTIISEGGWKMLAIIVGVVIAAPFVEELIFRAQLLPAITRRAEKKFDSQTAAIIGVVASSAVFAIIHLQFYAAPAQFVFGAALAIIYHRHRSLAEVTFLHMLVNLIGVVTIAGQ